jgi:endonuclease/exonuclease/phosphatase family metal-dependent hydrolase
MMTTRLGVVALTLAVLLGLTEPASASSTPPKVGLVSFVAAGYARSSHTASLTIDWPHASFAKKYEIFRSTSGSMSHAKKYTSTATKKLIPGLKPGTNYFFQVRGVNGKHIGKRSNHVGHTTIRDQGRSDGTAYRVMTYNLCSDKCSNWDHREPGVQERVTAFHPDVLAAQEANGLRVVPGYTQAVSKSAKRLYFKTSRFTLVPQTSEPAEDPGCSADGPPVYRTGCVFLGDHAGGGRYAVWAELVDKDANDRHVIFVDVHTVTGDSDARAKDRQAEITTLLAAMKVVNPTNLPVVFAGDFNSHKNRPNDYLAGVFHRNGYYDAYDLATTLYRQHINSYNDFSTTPKISYTWGDHVDHVWVLPGTSLVTGWRNGVRIVNGRLPTPIPSDHSPVVVDLRLN